MLAATRSIKQGDYAGAPLLKLELQLTSGETFSTTYRIPKAFTGKGQLDLFIQHLKALELGLTEIVGKTFVWKRKELPGAMKGNPRHYPIKLVSVHQTNMQQIHSRVKQHGKGT